MNAPQFAGVFTADSHIDRFNRLDDFACCVDSVIATTISKKDDLDKKYGFNEVPFIFSHGGDGYKTWHPAPIEMSVMHRFRKLHDHGIWGSIIPGNHDWPESEDSRGMHCFMEMKTLGGGLQVIDEPMVMPISSKNIRVGSYIYIPHLPKATLQRAGATYAEYFKFTLDSLLGQCPAGPIILFTHCYLKEAAVGPSDLVIEGDRQISVKDLMDPRLTAAMLGDIHKAQRLCEKPLILYPGSIDRIDFGEANEPKGFIYYEVWGQNDIRIEFIPTPARRFVHIIADLSPNQPEGSKFCDVPEKPSDIQPWLEAKFKDYGDLKGAIVKVTIKCGSSQKGQVDDRRLEDLLVKMGVERVRSVGFDMTEAKLQRAPDITESLNPAAALEKWIGTQKYPEGTGKTILDAGKKLIGMEK